MNQLSKCSTLFNVTSGLALEMARAVFTISALMEVTRVAASSLKP